MFSYYNHKPKQNRMATLWREKHPTSTLEMIRLKRQRNSLKNHLISGLKLEKLSWLTKPNNPVQEKINNLSDSPANTLNVLVDKVPLSVKN